MTNGFVRRGLPVALAGLLSILSPVLGAADEHLSVKTPRAFGYVIGDMIELDVSLALDPGFELDPASVPEPGRVSRWLSLNEASHASEPRDGMSRHAIRLRFQVVNAPESVTRAGTPPMSLRILGPDDDFPAVIPGWAFTISPIVTSEERPPGRLPDLRPALPPGPVPTITRTVRVSVLGGLALVLLALFAYAQVAERIRRRARGHFDRAYRRIQRRTAGSELPGVYADALLDMHAAFNATADRAVFEHDLTRFFIEHPRFESLRAPIAALFAESAAVHYGSSTQPAADAWSVHRVRDLCLACRDVERNP